MAEEACGEHAPDACAGMDRDGAARVVDLEAELSRLDHVGDEQARDSADVDGSNRRDEEAGSAACDEACNPAVGGDRGIWLAITRAGEDDGGEEACGRSERRIEDEGGVPQWRCGVKEDRRGGLKRDPADEGKQAA